VSIAVVTAVVAATLSIALVLHVRVDLVGGAEALTLLGSFAGRVLTTLVGLQLQLLCRGGPAI